MILAIVNAIVRLLVKLMARTRVLARSRIPDSGPLIVITNHINFFEAPLIYFLLKHRHPRAMAKAESWNKPFLRVLGNLWGAIPIRRGAVDKVAFLRAEKVLGEGGLVVITPEGTRSHHGRLQRASAGVVTLASHTGAPVLPIGHWGGEQVVSYLLKLRRPHVRVRVGRLLHVDRAAASSRETRAAELDRLMHALAQLLPEKYRGFYTQER